MLQGAVRRDVVIRAVLLDAVILRDAALYHHHGGSQLAFSNSTRFDTIIFVVTQGGTEL